VALNGGGDGHRKINTIGAPSTSMETVPETVAVPETTTTTESPTTTLPPTTTTTALVCRNSTNPKCGPFRWDPVPVSHPIDVSLTFSPPDPKPGDKVTVHLAATDQDTALGGLLVDFGDGHGAGFGVAPLCIAAPDPYGPWDPPPRQPDHKEYDYDNVYSAPGTYTVTAKVSSMPSCSTPRNPYVGEGTASVTVNVSGPPVTTTTTTAVH
jgi:hypothetical protein